MSRIPRVCDTLLEIGVLLLLVFTPLLFGGVHPFTYAVAETLVFILCVIWLLKSVALARAVVAPGGGGAAPLPTGVVLALVVFLSLVLLQLLNLPESVRAFLSPHASSLVLAMTRDLPAEARAGLPFHSTLSLYPYATQIELCKMISVVALFFLVAVNFRTKPMMSRCLGLGVLMGGACSFLGIAQRLSGTEKIYWFWTSEYGGGPFGTFPNRNDFAAYLNILIPIAVVLLFAGWEERRKSRAPGFLTSVEPRLWAGLVAVLSWLLLWVSLIGMASALFMCGSRGGAIGLGTSIVALAVLLSASQRGRRRLAGLIFAIAIMVFLAMFVAGEELITRFTRLASERRERLWIWRDTLKVIHDFPLLGTGLDTFMSIFPAYKANPTTSKVITHAHNEYLHLLLETGFAGAAAIALAVFTLFGRFLRMARAPSGQFEWWCVVGIFSGLAGVMANGLFTLCIRVPANLYLAAVVAGIGLVCVVQPLSDIKARARTDEEVPLGSPPEPSTLARLVVAVFPHRQAGMAGIKACRLCRPMGKNIGRWRPLLLSAGAALGMGIALPTTWHSFGAGSAFQAARMAEEDKAPISTQLRWLLRATRRDPSYARAYYEVARAYDVLARAPLLAAREFEDRTPSTRELIGKAILNYQRAIAAQPTHAEYHRALAVFLVWNPYLPQAERVSRVEAAFQKAIYLAPNGESNWVTLGEFYESVGDHERAVTCFQTAVGIRPRPLGRILQAMIQQGAPIRAIERILPARPDCFLTAAEALVGVGRPADARHFVEAARRFPEAKAGSTASGLAWIYLRLNETPLAIEWLQQCAAFSPADMALRRLLIVALLRNKQFDKALEAAQALVRDEPQVAENYLSLAGCLIAQGDLQAAEACYRKAVRLAPLDLGCATALSGLLRSEKRITEATGVMEDFLAKNSNSAQAHGQIAEMRAEQGRLDDALAEYERAAFLDPAHAAQWQEGRNKILTRKSLEKWK